MATRVLRPFVVAALAIFTKTFGRSGPATKAKPVDLRKVLRFIIWRSSLFLKLRSAQLEGQLLGVRRLDPHAGKLVRGQVDGEVHTVHGRAAVHPGVRAVAVARRRLRAVERLADLLQRARDGDGIDHLRVAGP